MVRIRRPVGSVFFSFMSPTRPARALPASEQLEEWPIRKAFDDLVLLVGLARMLALARRHEVDLSSTRWPRAGVLAPHSKQEHFRDVAEIEADASAIGSAISANFVPDEVRLVGEPP